MTSQLLPKPFPAFPHLDVYTSILNLSGNNISIAFTLNRKLDADRFRSTFIKFAQFYPEMNSHIKMVKNIYCLQKSAFPDKKLLNRAFFFEDVLGSSLNKINEKIENAVHCTFRLDETPLLRIHIYNLEHKQIILFVGHCSIWDRRSLVLLIEKLGEEYVADRLSHISQRKEIYYSQQKGPLVKTSFCEESSAESYWRKTLVTPLTELHLPTRTTSQDSPKISRNRDSILVSLTTSLTMTIRQLAIKKVTSMSALLLSAYEVLLARYANQMNFDIGLIEYDDCDAGDSIFGNTFWYLIKKAKLSTIDSFNSLVRANKEQIENIREFGRYPLQQIANSLGLTLDDIIRRFGSVGYIFQSLVNLPHMANNLALNKSSSASFTWAKRKVNLFSIAEPPTIWDLTLVIKETSDHLCCEWHFDSEKFKYETIERMAENFSTLLTKIVIDKNVNYFHIPLLSPTEYKQTIFHWNNTTVSYPKNKCLHQLFKEQVEKSPQNTAVICDEQQLSYQDLYSKASCLAAFLQKYGTRPNTLVAIMLEKSIEQVIATMGVLMSGSAFLPIEPNWPINRKMNIIKLGRIEIIVTLRKWVNLQICGKEEIRYVLMDEMEYSEKLILTEHIKVEISPTSLAYVIFTSGSTGTPKGVAVSHRSVINTITDINQRFQIDESDRVLAFSALTFDLSIYDIFGLLTVGGCVVILPDKEKRNGLKWLQLLRKHRITIWNTVPQILDILLRLVSKRDIKDIELQTILLSGDWIPLSLPISVKKLLPHSKLHSLGGATEAAIWSVTYPITEIQPEWSSIPYGKPMGNQKCYVLNTALQHCPIEVIGDLYISGDSLSVGYWDDETRTAESFITHPQLDERLYKTGDLARYLLDGNLEFIGRVDNQVKVNGYRIECGEIEKELCKLDVVNQAVVVAQVTNNCGNLNAYSRVKDSEFQRVLIAYITLNEQPPLDLDSQTKNIKIHLSQILPEYMIPLKIITVDSLPLTDNGKIDYKSLPCDFTTLSLS